MSKQTVADLISKLQELPGDLEVVRYSFTIIGAGRLNWSRPEEQYTDGVVKDTQHPELHITMLSEIEKP